MCLSFVVAAPSIAGPCSPDTDEAPTIFVPDRSCMSVGFGYQYQNYDVLGRTFHDNGFNVNYGLHLFDWLTGADGRLTVAAEGTTAFGFGHTGGKPNLDAKSLFVGGGPPCGYRKPVTLEPWAHVIAGLQHFRFTQGKVLGSNSDFGFMAGGGLDVRVDRGIYWRVQGDYVGTTFQSNEQSSYSVGTGFIFYF